jgi:hypothetical protein
MKRLIASACAALVAASVAVPAAAMPLGNPAGAQANDVVNVQYREGGRWQRGYERRGNDHYYNGQRGYREHRRGYRQYNGFWFPPAAFIAGAIIGGAINSQQPPVRVVRPAGNAHVQWCYDRYRSYRASDNTFQPYNGPRQACYSPYS